MSCTAMGSTASSVRWQPTTHGELGRPFVLELLGHYPARARNVGVKKIYNWLVTSYLVRNASYVVVTSPNEFKETAKLMGDTRSVVRRNGIDLTSFENLPSANIARARFGIPDQARMVLYVGRLTPIKNLLVLITAFQEAGIADAVLVLVGPAPEPDYEQRLKALVKKLDLTKRVIFAGALFGKEKLSMLAAAELFVLPSLNESFGNAAAEAVAAGVPVLISAECGIAPMIDQRAGLMVSLESGQFAAGIRRMMNDPVERKRLTARREEVVRELSWDEPIRQTESLYLQILAERTPECDAVGS